MSTLHALDGIKERKTCKEKKNLIALIYYHYQADSSYLARGCEYVIRCSNALGKRNAPSNHGAARGKLHHSHTIAPASFKDDYNYAMNNRENKIYRPGKRKKANKIHITATMLFVSYRRQEPSLPD